MLSTVDILITDYSSIFLISCH
ncbi:hypothetical protein PO124_34910 [Bacillus licheniformis]|nr:hypothetical protein [Bacillus licheniformis]